jgi:hypothetical protein
VSMAVIVVTMPPMIIIVAMLMMIAVPVVVVRHVAVDIPIVAHKVDWTAASIVSGTVVSPVLGLPRGDTQVDRWDADVMRRWQNHHRLGINELGRWSVSDGDLAVKARFANVDRHADLRARGDRHRQQEGG